MSGNIRMSVVMRTGSIWLVLKGVYGGSSVSGFLWFVCIVKMGEVGV